MCLETGFPERRGGRALRDHTSSGSDLYDACHYNIVRGPQVIDFCLLEFSVFILA